MALACLWRVHAGVGVEELEFAGCAEVADDEGAFADAPEAFAAGELGEFFDLGAGQAERFTGFGGFLGFLGVDDFGGAVGE
jgi:hypothetical protein